MTPRTLKVAHNQAYADTLADAHYGMLRTKIILKSWTLHGVANILEEFSKEGIRDELTIDPNADPIKLGKIAQKAGEMAIQINNFFDVPGESL